MRASVQKSTGTQRTSSAKYTRSNQSLLERNRKVHTALQSRRAIGSQVLSRLQQATKNNVGASSVSHAVATADCGFSPLPVNLGANYSIQTKLKVNASGDRYEQEAERVADEVLQQKMPERSDGTSGIQPAQGGDHEVNAEMENQLRRNKGSGNPISDPIRAVVERHLQFDFSKVRVHTDNIAARMNTELGARAFTYGNDIYFGKSEYQPHSSEGCHLIAHELTHVVQQNKGPVSNVVQRELDPKARGLLNENIISEMTTAQTDFKIGAVQAERDITAAALAEADIAKVIFGIGMALIVPGFGGVVSRVGASLGVTIAEATANVIGGAIGEIAKSAGNLAVDESYASNPRQIFTAVTSGFEAAIRKKRDWLRENIESRANLPDDVLLDLKKYWLQLAAKNEPANWATWFRSLWNRLQAQVGAIGRQGWGLPGPFGPKVVGFHYVPARIRLHYGGTRLALVERRRLEFTSGWLWSRQRDIRTYFRFLTWVDDDLAALAAARVSHVPTLNLSEVRGVPFDLSWFYDRDLERAR